MACECIVKDKKEHMNFSFCCRKYGFHYADVNLIASICYLLGMHIFIRSTSQKLRDNSHINSFMYLKSLNQFRRIRTNDISIKLHLNVNLFIIWFNSDDQTKWIDIFTMSSLTWFHWIVVLFLADNFTVMKQIVV